MKRLGLVIALLGLLGCSEPEVLLEGERLDVRGNPIPTETVNRAEALPLPVATANANWSHVGGSTTHLVAHPALDRSLALAWSVDIGKGNDRKHRIAADPIVANGMVYVMDSRSRVTSVSTQGRVVWSVDLIPSTDGADEGLGGGLAAAGDQLFATNGFGQLSALDAATGAVQWTHDFESGAAAPPMAANGVVYVATSNAAGWALSADTGRVLWQVFGATADRSSAGSPAPVAAGPLVVFPFASGQMVSAVADTGARGWAASVAGRRLGGASSALTDLVGGPVFEGDRIYAGSYAGRAAAFDATNGRLLWTAEEGAAGPLWVAGNSVFFVSDRNQLLRLDAATGATIWAENLPYFTRDRIRRRKSVFVHHGPILAGGRLLLASDDGTLRQYDPVTGALAGTLPLPDGVARNPAVAGGALFLVTENGQLHALK